jgi:putative ABC transport system permease protein
MSAATHKSWNDVRHRWARSLFTAATIAAAVSGLSLFAVMSILDRAMDQRVVDDRLHDIQLYTEDIELTPAEMEALRAIPGVSALDTRTGYTTRMRVGDRRIPVILVGVQSFEDQHVNAVQLNSGAWPGPAEALSDTQNARSGRFGGGAGSIIQVEDNHGGLHPITVSGRGATLQYTQVATDERSVLYASQSTVNEIAKVTGVNTLDFRVADATQAHAVFEDISRWFGEHRPDAVFTDLPDVRKAGTWPGQDVSENFTTLFYVGGVLALLSAIALVSNTMTTLVAEQRREIAIMKAIGARRRQIAASFLRTVWILAGAGTLLGIGLGIPFSNLIAGFAGRQFLGIDPDWGYSLPVVLLSLVVGVVGATLASIPALLRAARMPVREGLAAGLAATPGSWLDRLLRRTPLPRTAQVGLRNISRRKTRTAGTVTQVGLAAGVALGFLALGVTVGDITARTWDVMHWDVVLFQRSNVAFDDNALKLVRDLDGVRSAHPVLFNSVEVDGDSYEAWGLPTDVELYDPDIQSGRWLEPADADQHAHVAVVGRALAATAGLKAGDTVVLTTASGPVAFQVVGIDGRLINNATNHFISLSVFQEVLGRTDTNAFWLVSSSDDEPAIDRLAATAEDTLAAAGYPAQNQIRYVEREANLASNRILVGVLAVMGLPVVAIGLIGLVNMMTMNILERTREIGILRCIGARSRDITRIFRTEAMAVALLGWLLALPLGWLIGWILVWVVGELFKFGSVPYSYPVLYPPLALVATIGLAWLVVIAPLRRASHLRPGEALRYE